MEFLVIGLCAFAAAALTFFSGFGLGTLLMPVVAIFFPVEAAVAVTAVVHLANNLLKVSLVGRQARKEIVLRFGVPALVAAFFGAALLGLLANIEPWARYHLFGLELEIAPVKLVVGGLIALFVAAELSPQFNALTFNRSWMPFGGMVSGFLGGLSGHQGALRGMFLIKSGLTKEAYIGTGVVIAVMVDVARLSIYGASGESFRKVEPWLLMWAVLAAFAGTLLCNRLLAKVTIGSIRRLVSVLLLVVALGLVIGLV